MRTYIFIKCIGLNILKLVSYLQETTYRFPFKKQFINDVHSFFRETDEIHK